MKSLVLDRVKAFDESQLELVEGDQLDVLAGEASKRQKLWLMPDCKTGN